MASANIKDTEINKNYNVIANILTHTFMDNIDSYAENKISSLQASNFRYSST